jgi:ribosomal protein S12 methylthiotransferase accessory factor
MEAFERQALLWDEKAVLLRTRSHLEDHNYKFIPPEAFREWARTINPHEMVAWVEVESLSSDSRYLVPAEIVFLGDRPRNINPIFAVVTSNGCASGATLHEAQRHGIYEVIERHVVSKLEILNVAANAAQQELAKRIGLNIDHVMLPSAGASQLSVDMDGAAEELWSRLIKAGLSPTAIVTEVIGVGYMIGVFAVDSFDYNVHWINAGYAFRASAQDALISAIVEVAQTRATLRQGSREDYGLREKAPRWSVPKDPWFSRFEDHARLSDCPDYPELSISDLCKSAEDAFGSSLYMYQTEPILDCHAVRIFSPGAQNWHITGGLSSIKTQRPSFSKDL